MITIIIALHIFYLLVGLGIFLLWYLGKLPKEIKK